MPLATTSLIFEQALLDAVIRALKQIFPDLRVEGGAPEPFYQAPKKNSPAILFFRDDHIRSLFHELAHYSLAGSKRRTIDDFGFWYVPCGRDTYEQQRFEEVEARPQGLEKLFCEIWHIPFSPSLDDFSGHPISNTFIENLENAYIEMKERPPTTAKRVIEGMYHFVKTDLAISDIFSRL